MYQVGSFRYLKHFVCVIQIFLYNKKENVSSKNIDQFINQDIVLSQAKPCRANVLSFWLVKKCCVLNATNECMLFIVSFDDKVTSWIKCWNFTESNFVSCNAVFLVMCFVMSISDHCDAIYRNRQLPCINSNRLDLRLCILPWIFFTSSKLNSMEHSKYVYESSKQSNESRVVHVFVD